MRWEDSGPRESRRAQTRLAKLGEASRRINESWDLDTVLQEVADGARSLTGARFGAAGVFDGSGRVSDFTTSDEFPQSR